MNKYTLLFDFVEASGKTELLLSFDEIEKIAGVTIDHSFLQYKKELKGYLVKKISMKNKSVLFEKLPAS